MDLDEVKKCIDTYATILLDDNYYWTYKWNLYEFLSRKNAISTFVGKEPKNYVRSQNIASPETVLLKRK